MNEYEILLLVVGAQVIAMVAIIFLSINALRKTKLEHGLELAKILNCNIDDFEKLKKQKFDSAYVKKEMRFVTIFGFFIQILFSIALLASSSFLTVYLIQQEFIEWSVYTGVLALVGLVMLSFTLGAIIHRRRTINHINQYLDSYEKTLKERKRAPEIAKAKLVAEPKPLVAEPKPLVAEPKPLVAEPKPLPETVSSPKVQVETKPYAVDIDENIPEDSMLRRHYLTMRRVQREDSEQREQSSHAGVKSDTLKAEEDVEFGKIPEDSMLRRHYLTHLRTQKEEQEQSGQLTHVVEQAKIKVTPKQDRKETIPEDSTLRRHFITNLIARIESDLPSRPTDSTLRRHFDSLVEAEKEKRLAAMSH